MSRLTRAGNATVTLSAMAIPREANEAYKKAEKALSKKKVNHSKVVRQLERAVEFYPEFASAWDLLGRVRMQLKDQPAARTAFARALSADSGLESPYLGMAQIELEQRNWSEAVTWTDELLALNPGHPQGLYWNGFANFYLNRGEEAERAFRRLEQEGHLKTYPAAFLRWGILDARQGSIRSAAVKLRSYLEFMPEGQIQETQRARIERQLKDWEADAATWKPGTVENPGPLSESTSKPVTSLSVKR